MAISPLPNRQCVRFHAGLEIGLGNEAALRYLNGRPSGHSGLAGRGYGFRAHGFARPNDSRRSYAFSRSSLAALL
jgi:hypothetical protein